MRIIIYKDAFNIHTIRNYGIQCSDYKLGKSNVDVNYVYL